MLQLEHEWKQLCRQNRSEGHTTQGDRRRMAKTIAGDLEKCGYGRFVRGKGCAQRLKQKHVQALVDYWRGKGLSDGTIANRLAFLRRVTAWTGRPNVVHKTNAEYGLSPRGQAATEDKSLRVGKEVLDRVADRRVRASLRLSAALGLRREESIKIVPSHADHGNRLVLDGPWCKGGRGREIAITTPEQREALDFAKEVAEKGSLIPPWSSYVEHRDGAFQRACEAVGLNHRHGLRHAYVQDKYKALTGWECPVRGGPTKDGRDGTARMTPEQVEKDRWARSIVAEDLGHSRRGITNKYLGKG